MTRRLAPETRPYTPDTSPEAPARIWAAPDDVEGWARIGRWNVDPAWDCEDEDYVRADLADAWVAERDALRAEVERLREAGARVVQAFDAAKDAGSPHKLSPAAALAMNALRAVLTAPSRPDQST